MKKGKFVSLSLVLLGACSCLVSCGGGESENPMAILPLNAAIWNEDMSEKIQDITSPWEIFSSGEEKISLSLDTTYVLEFYIYHESTDPNYNYTDTEISYNDISLDYDTSQVKISKVEEDKEYTPARSCYYYLSGLCESNDTCVEAYIPNQKIDKKKRGGELEFNTFFYLSFC